MSVCWGGDKKRLSTWRKRCVVCHSCHALNIMKIVFTRYYEYAIVCCQHEERFCNIDVFAKEISRGCSLII